VSASLIDRVRERLAAEAAPLRPTVVADAIRAESGGVLGDTEVLNSLRVLQTELTGAGILEPLLRAEGTTDVLVTARTPSGLTTEKACAAPQSGSPMRTRCVGSPSGWHWRPDAVLTKPNRG
jgi:hypothetical protein